MRLGLLLALLCAGCEAPSADPAADAQPGMDAEREDAGDAAADTSADAVPDVALPELQDAAIDAGPDARPDGAPDLRALPDAISPLDAEPDTGPDAERDAEADAERDASPPDEPDAAPPCPEGSVAAGSDCLDPWPCPEAWLRDAEGVCAPPEPLRCESGVLADEAGECDAAWPCPEGWARSAYGACTPALRPCPVGQWTLLGGGCLNLHACPPERWPEDVEGAVFVDLRADPEVAEGTAERPFVDLARALATGATQIALTDGLYEVPPIDLGGGRLELVGRCPARVRIRSQALDAGPGSELSLRGLQWEGRLHSEGGQLDLERVRVLGSRPVAVVVDGGGELSARELEISSPASVGLMLDGATGDVDRLVFSQVAGTAVSIRGGAQLRARDVMVLEVLGLDGLTRGFDILSGEVEADDVVLVDLGHAANLNSPQARLRGARWWYQPNRPALGPVAVAGAQVELRDIAFFNLFSGGRAQGAGSLFSIERGALFGGAANRADLGILDAVAGGRVTLSQVRLASINYQALFAAAATLELQDVAILDLLPDQQLGGGRAITAVDGADLHLDRVFIARCAGTGIALLDSSIEGSRLVIEDTGRLAIDLSQSQARISDLWVEGATRAGVAGRGLAGTLELRRARVGGTRSPDRLDGMGVGLIVFDGEASVEDTLLERSLEAGVIALGGAVELRRTVIRDTRSLFLRAGLGLAVEEGANVSLEQVRIFENQQVGVSVHGSVLDAEDLWIRGTAPRSVVGEEGRGVNAEGGAELSLRSVRVEGSHDIGLRAATQDTLVQATDLSVVGTQPEQHGGTGGFGVVVQTGAELDLVRAEVLENHGTGLVVLDARLTAEGVHVSGTRRDGLGLADGVFAGSGAAVDIRGLRSDENAGAGLVMSGATLRVDGGHLRRNAVGLVRQLVNQWRLIDVDISDNAEGETRCADVCVDVPPPPEGSAGLPPP